MERGLMPSMRMGVNSTGMQHDAAILGAMSPVWNCMDNPWSRSVAVTISGVFKSSSLLAFRLLFKKSMKSSNFNKPAAVRDQLVRSMNLWCEKNWITSCGSFPSAQNTPAKAPALTPEIMLGLMSCSSKACITPKWANPLMNPPLRA